MKNISQDFSGCPWFGPLPCTEKDYSRFFGRKEEMRELLSKVRSQKLTILSAKSGAGKTSLVNAGLLPLLRGVRERTPEEIGFAINLRDWAKVTVDLMTKEKPSHARLVKETLFKALESLAEEAKSETYMGKEQMERDLPALLFNISRKEKPQEQKSDPAKDLEELESCLKSLRDSIVGKKLILIIDQAEELLGSGGSIYFQEQNLNSTIQILTKLIDLEGIRLVISLRSEYLDKLRKLEEQYFPIGQRAYLLQPLTWAAARTTILESAKLKGNLQISSTEVNEVLTWVSDLDDYAEKYDSQPIDMLAVQACFYDIYRFAQRGMEPNGFWIINDNFLTRYKKDLEEKEPRLKDSGTSFSEGPMLRWIDNVFSHLPPGNLIERVTANMGGLLSTPKGFKSHSTEGDLIFQAIRKDIPIREMEKIKMKVVRETLAKGENLEFSEDVNSQLVINMATASRDALELLREKNILKEYGQDEKGSRILSLQHDGFGPAFNEWCYDERRRENDVLVPEIGIYGFQIRRNTSLEKSRLVNLTVEAIDNNLRDKKLSQKERQNLENNKKELELENGKPFILEQIIWGGCYLQGVNVKDIAFIDCNFSGSFFENCTFSDCIFTRCEFEGSFFSEGSFTNITFENCSCLGLVSLGMEWDNVSFTEKKELYREKETVFGDMSSSMFKNIYLFGRLEFNGIKARFAQFHEFKPLDGKDFKITAHGCDLYGTLFVDYDKDNEIDFKSCINVDKVFTDPPSSNS